MTDYVNYDILWLPKVHTNIIIITESVVMTSVYLWSKDTSATGIFIKAVCVLIEYQQFSAGDISELCAEPTEYIYFLSQNKVMVLHILTDW